VWSLLVQMSRGMGHLVGWICSFVLKPLMQWVTFVCISVLTPLKLVGEGMAKVLGEALSCLCTEGCHVWIPCLFLTIWGLLAWALHESRVWVHHAFGAHIHFGTDEAHHELAALVALLLLLFHCRQMLNTWFNIGDGASAEPAELPSIYHTVYHTVYHCVRTSCHCCTFPLFVLFVLFVFYEYAIVAVAACGNYEYTRVLCDCCNCNASDVNATALADGHGSRGIASQATVVGTIAAVLLWIAGFYCLKAIPIALDNCLKAIRIALDLAKAPPPPCCVELVRVLKALLSTCNTKLFDAVKFLERCSKNVYAAMCCPCRAWDECWAGCFRCVARSSTGAVCCTCFADGCLGVAPEVYPVEFQVLEEQTNPVAADEGAGVFG